MEPVLIEYLDVSDEQQAPSAGVRRTAKGAARLAGSVVTYSAAPVLQQAQTASAAIAASRVLSSQTLGQTPALLQMSEPNFTLVTPQSFMAQNPVWNAAQAAMQTVSTPFQQRLQPPNLCVSRAQNYHVCLPDSHQYRGSSEQHRSSLSNGIPASIQEGIKGKLIHHLEHGLGKSRAMLAEFFVNMCIEGSCENSQNPWRDRAISAATHVSITEAVASVYKRSPAYRVVLGCYLAGEIAAAGKSALDAVAKNQEVAEAWDRQFLLANEGLPFSHSVALAKVMAEVASWPSELLHKVHHEIATFAAAAFDNVEVTDENVAHVTVKTLQFIAEHSPELCEERMWARAITACQQEKK